MRWGVLFERSNSPSAAFRHPCSVSRALILRRVPRRLTFAAARHPLKVGGLPVYGAWFDNGMGYRIDITKGVAKGNDPETLCECAAASTLSGRARRCACAIRTVARRPTPFAPMQTW